MKGRRVPPALASLLQAFLSRVHFLDNRSGRGRAAALVLRVGYGDVEL
jgi:hypothetical protein